MSIIIGIKEKGQLILAGDKRGSSQEGTTLSDNLQKVIPINNNLCLATAENESVGKAILFDVKKAGNTASMSVEDLLEIINQFYQRVSAANISTILNYPFAFLIAGQKNDGNSAIIAGQNKAGHIEATETSVMIFPPVDCTLSQCAELFAKNRALGRSTYIENTVRDIAKLSKVVSASGEKWVYTISTKTGTLISF